VFARSLGEFMMDLSWIWIWIWIEIDMEMTEMAETHVEINQFPVPRVGPRHSTHVLLAVAIPLVCLFAVNCYKIVLFEFFWSKFVVKCDHLDMLI